MSVACAVAPPARALPPSGGTLSCSGLPCGTAGSFHSMIPAPHPTAIRWYAELAFEPGSQRMLVISTGEASRRPGGMSPARTTNSLASEALISSTIASPEFVFHSRTSPFALPVKRREPFESRMADESNEPSCPLLVLKARIRGAVPDRGMNSLIRTSPASHN